MQLLRDLYRVYSPSCGEKKMRKFIKDYIRRNIPDAKYNVKDGNIYVTRGESDTYPCLVSHMDQVQRNHSKDFRTYIVDGKVFGFSPAMMKMQGLGADDKNGIWVCLKCLEKYDVMKCVFFWGEEQGCLGSAKADMKFFGDCRWVIQCDRRDGGDLITDASCTELCSREFVDALDAEEYGYKETSGLMTDVMELKENGLKVACCNLSCGYYEPHTDEEYTDIKELENCLAFVEHIVETVTAVYPHEYVDRWKGGYNGYGYDGYGYGYGYNDTWEPTDTELEDYMFDYWGSNPDATPEDVAWEMMYYSSKKYPALLEMAKDVHQYV